MMSVSPYTMETLYRQGSIDYIPYDALTPVAPVKSYSSQGQNSIEQSFNPTGETQNLAKKQIQELQRMSQGPITLYPKTQQVNINNNYYNSADTFSYSNSTSPLGEMSGSVVNEIRNIKSQPATVDNSQDSFRASILSEEDKKGTQKPLSNNKIWIKSLISLSAIGLTLFALFKGGKAISSSSGSFWSKLNPRNWFK